MDLMDILGAYIVVLLIFAVIMIVSQWKIFEKAGQPGWAALVPIYNMYVFSQVIGRPQWWIVLYFLAIIPVVGWIGLIVIVIMDYIRLANVFGKSGGFAVGLIFLGIIFFPMLAFGDSTYQGKPTN
jgi:hypothetical protein